MSAFVQANTADDTGTTSGVITLPSAPGAGHLLALVVSATSAVSTVTDSQGNTWTKATGSFSADFEAFFTTSNGTAGAYIATASWASSAGSTKFLAISEYIGPTSFVFDAATYIQDAPCPGSVSFTASGAGELAVLAAAAGNTNSFVQIGGAGVTQRAGDVGFTVAIGDKLSTAAGSNLWSDGSLICGCSPGSILTVALVFKTPSTAPKSVLFDAMNE